VNIYRKLLLRYTYVNNTVNNKHSVVIILMT